MATEVVMPQMGESIAEGTIVRWIKKVGDAVERDEPLFEISTDKVDAEIPSPVAGVVTEIRAKEGETVPVNSVVAVIGASGPVGRIAPAEPARVTPSQPSPVAPSRPVAVPRSEPAPVPPSRPVSVPPPQSAPPPAAGVAQAGPALPAQPAAPSASAVPVPGLEPQRVSESREPSLPESRQPGRAPAPGRESGPVPESAEDVIRQRSSPLVRRIAKEHNVDISRIDGTGIAGRVTKDDILAFLDTRAATPSHEGTDPGLPGGVPPAQDDSSVSTGAGSASSVAPAPRPAPSPGPAAAPGLAGRVVPMSIMRKKIAEHMIASRRTSAHVHSVFEVNFGRVAQIREAKKAEYERAGAKLTYLSFILKAATDALRAVPVVNASVDGDNIVYHGNVNVGIAVALDWGLIVPVVKNADEKNLLGLSRAIADLAGRARSKQLKPEEVTGGTFTITNPGVFGALFGMPIINQPQVAILGVGHIEKRPVVIDDAIAIRPMAYLSLGYDHRIIDGAVADEFMSHIKKALESWDPAGD
jgi:pyruvate dehydrogenase E2 component (dihydrolipoamide acetyltransferase)